MKEVGCVSTEVQPTQLRISAETRKEVWICFSFTSALILTREMSRSKSNGFSPLFFFFLSAFPEGRGLVACGDKLRPHRFLTLIL